METMSPGSQNRLASDDKELIAAELGGEYDQLITDSQADDDERKKLTDDALHELTERTPGDRLLRTAREVTPEITHPDIRDQAYIALAESYGARGNIATARDMVDLIEDPRRKIQGLAALAEVTGFDTFALEAMKIPEQVEEYDYRKRIDLLAELHVQLADNEAVADALERDRQKATGGDLKAATTMLSGRPPDNLSQLTTIALISGRSDDLERATEAIRAHTISYKDFPSLQAAVVYRSYYDREGPEAAQAWLEKMEETVGQYIVTPHYKMNELVLSDRAEKYYPNQDSEVAELLARAREGGAQVMDLFFAGIEEKPSPETSQLDLYDINRRRNQSLYVYTIVSAQLARDELSLAA